MSDYQIKAKFDEEALRWIVSLKGEFDIFNAADLKAKIAGLFDEKDADICLDCSEMAFMDSTALGALVAARKAAALHNRKISVSRLKSSIRKLFRLTSLDKLFEIEGDSDE